MASTPRKRTKRHIKVPGQETAAERQARTAVRVIMDCPQYPILLRWLRSGTPIPIIAEQAIERNFFDLTQKTLAGYLYYFKKHQPGMCKPQAPREGTETQLEGYDHLFVGDESLIDEETELLRLIRLQKARLGIGFMSERNINMLMRDNRREVEELRNLLVDLAKLRGKIGTGGMELNLNYAPNVNDDLKGIKQDERQRSTVATLVADLARISTQ